MTLLFFTVGGILGGMFGRLLVINIERYFQKRSDKQFIRRVRVIFPNAEKIESIAVSGNDKEAMNKIEGELRNASGN